MKRIVLFVAIFIISVLMVACDTKDESCDINPNQEKCKQAELTCEEDSNQEKCKLTELTCEEDPTQEKCQDVKKDSKELLSKAISEIKIPSTLTTNIDLIRTLTFEGEEITISWGSSNTNFISRQGLVTQSITAQEVILTAYLFHGGESLTHDFTTTVLPLSNETRMEIASSTIDIPTTISGSLEFVKEFTDTGVSVSWTTSDESIISSQGIVILPQEDTDITITAILKCGGEEMEINYFVKVLSKNEINHLVKEYASDFKTSNMENVHLDADNKLIIDDNKTEGTYTSQVFETLAYSSVIGSFSAITSTTTTVELLVRVKVNNVWSDYITYSPWGLGLNNGSTDHTTKDGLAKLSDDEIKINGSTKASAIQYKLILRRMAPTDISAQVSLVALALELAGYIYKPNISNLPATYDHDVPYLYQRIVPTIGGSICSPTSSTMLLKYKGHDFSSYDQYEHRYIANLAYDHGNAIYGNWVFNAITMGAFGENAYVMRMYSQEELMNHLANVGPVAASVKGYMAEGNWSTNGHLIVIRGYVERNGTLYFICNDPALQNVYIEYSANTIANVWRNIVYVIE